MATGPLVGAPLRRSLTAAARALGATSAATAAEATGRPLLFCRAQQRHLGIWETLKPWGAGKEGKDPQDAKQQHGAEKERSENSQPEHANPTVPASTPTSPAAAAAGTSFSPSESVIPSRLWGGPQGTSAGAPPFARAQRDPQRIPPALLNSGASKRPRQRLSHWQASSDCWMPLSAPELQAELRRIFLATSERRPEPRRREEAPVCRSTRKPLGPLLTRLAKSSLFLTAARHAAPAPVAPAADAAASVEEERGLFALALDFYFREGFGSTFGASQRMLVAGGVRVLHPSRQRGAPDGKPPDVTKDQFCAFALSFYAYLLKKQLPFARPPAVSTGTHGASRLSGNAAKGIAQMRVEP